MDGSPIRTRRFIRLVAVFLAVIFCVFSVSCGRIDHGHLTGFSGPDGRAYELYVPSSYDGATDVPLVVMLHGGTQTAADVARLTRMDDYAELHGFIVLYPEQSADDNPERYWNWFLSSNQYRGSGEPESLADIVRAVLSDYAVDPEAVVAAGFSAGACAAVALGVLYPDLVRGVAAAAGLGFGVAGDALGAYAAMAGTLPAAAETAALAFDRMPDGERRPLRILLVHGTDDARVDLVNADHLATQMALLDGLLVSGFPDEPTAVADYAPEGRHAFTVSDYAAADGFVQIRKYVVAGMAHRWPGGPAEEPYGDPLAPDFSALVWDFFFAAG